MAGTSMLASMPVLHTFVYTVRGVLETELLLRRQDFIDRAVRSSLALVTAQSPDGMLPGKVHRDYSSKGFRCRKGATDG